MSVNGVDCGQLYVRKMWVHGQTTTTELGQSKHKIVLNIMAQMFVIHIYIYICICLSLPLFVQFSFYVACDYKQFELQIPFICIYRPCVIVADVSSVSVLNIFQINELNNKYILLQYKPLIPLNITNGKNLYHKPPPPFPSLFQRHTYTQTYVDTYIYTNIN